MCGDQSSEERFENEAMPHLNDLFRTALRMTGERGQAEDVTQEVYLQAWRSFERFEAGTNCRAWLYKILFHCVSHQRRKGFRFRLLKENEEFLVANLVQPAAVAQEITDGEILAALDDLPSEFRSVVLLVDVEEFAYKEVAEILAIPIGTVMSRASSSIRKRVSLRKCPAHDGGARLAGTIALLPREQNSASIGHFPGKCAAGTSTESRWVRLKR
jgi:RNA polymerase sigma-70 factor (ECF subfamily)